eukprot:TRINITY_DN1480_c0_g1_i1.p1 TRINITY_DN1480_c0_g1~~TRINITY_DN1480_c0_g1_i1.p1  ORF type:complete len:323 (+),score=65.86 TRINITY_DN1480_c0_g1_i1:26-994(+)
MAYGGTGGYPFNDGDLVDHSRPINKIIVTYDKSIDSIQVFYDIPTSSGTVSFFKWPVHGGSGGNKTEEIVLNGATGEHINQVDVRYSDEVHGLTFYVRGSTGTRKIHCGASSGGKVISCKQQGKVLGSIYGRSGSRLDQIGFNWIADYVTEMTFKKLNLSSAGPGSNIPIVSVDHLTFDNTSEVTQSFNFERTYSEVVTEDWSSDAKLAFGTSVSVKIGADVPGIEDYFKISTKFTDEAHWKWGEAIESEVATTVKDSVKVEPKTKKTVNIEIRKGTREVPYTATVVCKYSSGRKEIVEMNGVLTAVTVGAVSASVVTEPLE